MFEGRRIVLLSDLVNNKPLDILPSEIELAIKVCLEDDYDAAHFGYTGGFIYGIRIAETTRTLQ